MFNGRLRSKPLIPKLRMPKIVIAVELKTAAGVKTGSPVFPLSNTGRDL